MTTHAEAAKRRHEIGRAYAAGIEVKIISESFKVTPERIWQITKMLGIPPRRCGRPKGSNGRTRITPAQREEIILLYVAGEKTIAIARQYGITKQYVRVLARQRGIPGRPCVQRIGA